MNVVLEMLISGFILDVLVEMSNECQEGDASNMCHRISEEGWGHELLHRVVGI